MNIDDLIEDIEEAKIMLNDADSTLMINALEMLIEKQDKNFANEISNNVMEQYINNFKNSYPDYPFPNCIYPKGDN